MSKFTKFLTGIYEKRTVWLTDLLDKPEILHDKVVETVIVSTPACRKAREAGKLTKEQKQAIDNYYRTHYGRRIPYIWHRMNMAYSGKFDPRMLPDVVFNGEFVRFMGEQHSYRETVHDKNFLPMIAEAAGIRMPKIYVSRVLGAWRDADCHFISRERAFELLRDRGEVFIKVTKDTDNGDGCLIADFQNGVDVRTGKTVGETLLPLGDEIAVQERVRNNATLASIYPHSLNVFRIFTYRWRGKIEVMPVALKFGRGGQEIDSIGYGGMVVALDNDGTMHDTAITEDNQHFTAHPDTGTVFANIRIPQVPQLIDCCVHLHEMLCQLGLVGWDITLGENDEPLLVEANTNSPDLQIVQSCHGCSGFGENTEDVLHWVRQMKHIRRSKRAPYAFGKMKNG